MGSARQALDSLGGLGAVVVVAECPARGDEGPELVRQVAAADPCVRTVLVAAESGIPEAVAVMRAGAYGYLGKPVGVRELLRVMKAALDDDRETLPRKGTAKPARDDLGLDGIIGVSPPMARLKGRLKCLLEAFGIPVPLGAR